ncbi:MAG: hypothetical protein EHM91_00740, partial [Planctomycetota bacterium]
MRAVAVLLGAALMSCGGSTASTGAYPPIAGTLQLTIGADGDYGSSFWAVLRRDGADEFRTEPVKAGVRTAIAWKEEVRQPRDWKLKFGPSRHPTYQLIVTRNGGAKPDVTLATLAGFNDPAKSLAIAYFAMPLDGEKELKVEIRKPAPIELTVMDSSGAPLEGARILGIATPRYLFEDGFDPEGVDAMHTTWSFDFWTFDHVPNHKITPERVKTTRTDAKGTCRLEG